MTDLKDPDLYVGSMPYAELAALRATGSVHWNPESDGAGFWAVLGFDIGADGVIGNVTVLAAQPSEEFGTAGMAVLQSGKFQPSEETHTRCIERVRFVTKKDRTEKDTAEPAGS